MSRRYWVVCVVIAMGLSVWALWRSDRYAVASTGGSVVLLDVKTGDTWVADRGSVGAWTWQPLKRHDDPPVSMVSALLSVSNKRGSVLEPKEDGDPEQFRRQQISMVKSRFVIAAALKKPEVGKLSIVRDLKEPLHWIEENLQAGFSEPEQMWVGLPSGKNEE